MEKQRRRSPYSFLPLSWSRGAFLKWLRRTHAWLGLWGATLDILLWTRLHGPRLLAAGLIFGALTLAIIFVWRTF